MTDERPENDDCCEDGDHDFDEDPRCLFCNEAASAVDGRLRDKLALAEAALGHLTDEARMVKPALEFLLTRIGSWTSARWDQHLRYEYGDEATNNVIAALASLGIVPHLPPEAERHRQRKP